MQVTLKNFNIYVFNLQIPLSRMIEPHLSAPHPHPNGYIVKYIPHNKQSKL